MLCQRVSSESFTRLWWNREGAEEEHVKRLGALMRAMVSRAEQRFSELTRVKTAVDEQSADQRLAFEKGYIMGDIIETYRKAVVYTEKQLAKNKNRYQETDRLRYMMYVQNAYIKVYHLVHMMHEINPKFGTDNSGQISEMNMNSQLQARSPTYYNTSGFYYAEQLKAIQQQRKREVLKKRKREQLIREQEVYRHGVISTGTVKQTANWWPVLYGWDMDYYW